MLSPTIIARPIASRIFWTRQVSPAIAITTTPNSAQRRFYMGNKMATNNTTNDAKGFIDQEIASHQVVIFSKSYCPYCIKTKQLFAGMSGVEVTAYELDKMSNGNEIQNQLAQMTGQRSVPNVFVHQQHVGGNDDTHAAHRNGTLAKLLEQK